MNTLKYNIHEKVNHIKLYHSKEISAIKRKRWYQITIGLILSAIAIYLWLFQIKVPGGILMTWVILFMGLSLIAASIWILTRKQGRFKTKNIDSLSSAELKNYLIELSKYEDQLIDNGAREIASNMAILIISVFALLAPVLSAYFKQGKLNFFETDLDSGRLILVIFALIHFFSFLIARLIGSPLLPRKYLREKQKLSNKIIFGFNTNLDNSPLNPSNYQ